MNTEKKIENLTSLYDEWSDCTRCGLCNPAGRKRTNVVFGQGNPNASVMIIGEAPGQHEDATGEPFSPNGNSGGLVDQFLGWFNASRGDVFLANVVGCRPTESDNPKKNRKPTKEEITACLPRIHRLIEVVDPFVVLLLGDVAFKALSTSKETLTQAAKAGQKWYPSVPVVTPGRQIPVERPGIVTFHPSYLLQNWNTTEGSDVHHSFRAWQKAFKLSDTIEQVLRGTTPPDRGGKRD